MGSNAKKVLTKSLEKSIGDLNSKELNGDLLRSITPVFVGKFLSMLDKVSNIEVIDLPSQTKVYELGKTYFGDLASGFTEASNLAIDKAIEELKNKNVYLYTVVPKIDNESKIVSLLVRSHPYDGPKSESELHEVELRRKLDIAKTKVFHRIYYDYEDDFESILKKVRDYLEIGYDRGMVKDFELHKGVDEETFRPFVMVIVTLSKNLVK